MTITQGMRVQVGDKGYRGLVVTITRAGRYDADTTASVLLDITGAVSTVPIASVTPEVQDMRTTGMYYGADALGVLTNDIASWEEVGISVDWAWSAGTGYEPTTDPALLVLQHVAREGISANTVTYSHHKLDTYQRVVVELWAAADRSNPVLTLVGEYV